MIPRQAARVRLRRVELPAGIRRLVSPHVRLWLRLMTRRCLIGADAAATMGHQCARRCAANQG